MVPEIRVGAAAMGDVCNDDEAGTNEGDEDAKSA